MTMNGTTLIGLIAALCTTASFLPPVINTLTSKKTKDISLLMYAILTTGIFFWLVYGILLKDFPLILANVISFSLSVCVLVMKLRHG